MGVLHIITSDIFGVEFPLFRLQTTPFKKDQNAPKIREIYIGQLYFKKGMMAYDLKNSTLSWNDFAFG